MLALWIKNSDIKVVFDACRGSNCVVSVVMAHAVVLVLGDLGRSPRMQYHAWSLSQLEGISSITQVGYSGEKVIFPDDSIISERRFSPWEFNWLRKVAILHAGLLILYDFRKGCHIISLKYRNLSRSF